MEVSLVEERGLPIDLVDILREAPDELDPGRGGKEATAYYTTDDDDALGMARAMVVARGKQ